MHITVAAIGRQRGGPQAALFHRYADLIRSTGPATGVTRFSFVEIDERKGPRGPRGRAWQADHLLRAVPESAMMLALDERGRAFTSRAFAEEIGRRRDEGQHLAFLIGGPEGHGQAVLERAALTLSLGPATWPHLLVRVMLAEQIYRALSILSGHPYHRD